MRWTPEQCIDCDDKWRCRKDGICSKTNLPIPEWNEDFSVAVIIYNKVVFLSGVDMCGNPQLNQMEFVLKNYDYEINNKDKFLNYIEALHSYTCRINAEKSNR